MGDYAHVLECKYNKYRGTSPLGLGYDMSNGREASQAYVNSYVPAISYKCKHIAPVVQVICKGKGIAVPNEYLEGYHRSAEVKHPKCDKIKERITGCLKCANTIRSLRKRQSNCPTRLV